MAWPAPQEITDAELMARSALNERGPFRRLLDFLIGGSPSERFVSGFGRIGVLPGRERLASDIIKRGLKEPWFHGVGAATTGYTPAGAQNILATGFDPSRLGIAAGLRLGEPAGVSLTRSPEVARKFGDVLRVGVDIPPSSVGQFVDPEMQRLLRAGYSEAKRAVPLTSFPEIDELVGVAATQANMQRFNQAMSDYLRQQGVEAIAYNPRRWAEYELRVLDPNKAVPLGRMPPYQGSIYPRMGREEAILTRYLTGHYLEPTPYRGLREALERQFQAAPEFPVRLRDVLGTPGAD